MTIAFHRHIMRRRRRNEEEDIVVFEDEEDETNESMESAPNSELPKNSWIADSKSFPLISKYDSAVD